MNIGIILAAGSGQRTGLKLPKQFVLINEKPLITFSLDTFEKNKLIDKIFIVTSPDYKPYISTIFEKFHYKKLVSILDGSSSRQGSVKNAVFFLKTYAKPEDIIAIHDSARPYIDDKTLTDCISCASKTGASCAYQNASDTIAVKNDGEIIKYLDRNAIAMLQTPQCFKYDIILKAHENAENLTATDDTSLVLQLGKKVSLVLSNNENQKITTFEDLQHFKNFIDMGKTSF